MNNIWTNEPPILYELLVYEEWLQEPEPAKCCNAASPSVPQSFPLSPQRIIKYLRTGDWPSEELINAVSPLLPWHIALSPNGQMVAILQESLLEIRSHEDDFTSTIGKANLQKEQFPTLRILKWHPENTKIAIGSSNGSVNVFDAYCNHLYSISQSSGCEDDSPKHFVAGIEFLVSQSHQFRSEELLIIYSNGLLKTFAIPERDALCEKHTAQLDIKQISCAIYSRPYDVIFIASQPQPATKFFQDSCLTAGLSSWRIVSEYPYYKKLFPNEDEFKLYKSGGTLWRMLHYSKSLKGECHCYHSTLRKAIHEYRRKGVAIKLSISQNNKYLASLHSCSTIIIWLIPSLRMFQKWSMEDTALDVSGNNANINNAPVDIGWRHDEKLIVSRKDGSISVHNAETFELCYGSGSELLSGYPRISSTENFPGFVSLECDTALLSPTTEDSTFEVGRSLLDTSSELIQNTIYYITDIESFQPRKKSTKIVQKIYRMIGVRSTTPEELFWRKLDSDDYNGALDLADEFSLNSDEVYKKLWRCSVVSSASIAESLSKIKNASWILNECIQRVPESVSGAEDLFNFAVQFSSLKNLSIDVERYLNVDNFLDLEELSELDKEKIRCRAVIFSYIDKLRAYRAILGGDPDKDGTYNMQHFGKFRRLPIVESAILFARECNIQAVETLFNHYPLEMMAYWLTILENIPEVYSPSNYRMLLPQCDDYGHPVPWQGILNREKDWVESDKFKNLMVFSIEEPTMLDVEPTEQLTSLIFTEWYRKRALEIEFRCNLVSNSLTLIQLAMDRNIKDLDDLHSNLVTLECMVYELKIDIDLSALLNMNDLQKCIKMLENVEPADFTNYILNYIFLYLSRHHIDGEQKFMLIHDLLVHFSQTSLKCSLIFIKYLLEGNTKIVGTSNDMVNLIVDCVYNYPFLDLVEESLETIDSCISWTVTLAENIRRDRKNLLKLLNSLRDETSAAKILSEYQIPISVRTIHFIKTDIQEIRSVFENVCASIVREYVKGENLPKINECLNDIQSLHELCFDAFYIDDCFEIYAHALLHSHNLSLVEESKSVLCSQHEIEKRSCLTFQRSVKLVLQAAEKYFDLSESANDEPMKLAKACLFLIKDDHPAINQELELIQALGHLNDIGVHLIPIQVRQLEDRLKLICMCLEKKRQLYTKPHFVYKLAAKLRVSGDDLVHRHNLVTKKLAEYALLDGADAHCMKFCKDLVFNNYPEGWDIVYQLLTKGVQGDQLVKKLLWLYCTVHAPSSLLKELVKIRRLFCCVPPRRTNEFVRSSTYSSSLANTPDSEDADDFHLASSDSSYKLDESSDAEAACYTSPYFYPVTSKCQEEQLSDYRIITIPFISHPLFHILHVWPEENVISFVESRPSTIDSWLIDSKLIELAGRYMNKDTRISLGYLLNTSDPSSCEDFFHNLLQVPFTQELAIYYFAYCSLRDIPCDVFRSPSQLVAASYSVPDSPYKSIISKFRRKLDSLVQAESLKEEQCGVNYERFMEDEAYKTDTIFGLAMSPEKLNIALELAKKNNIPLIDIAMTFVESLFLGDNLDPLLKSCDDGGEVHEVLKSSPEAVQRFMRHYDAIDGRDYKKLSNFFKIILYFDEQYLIESLTPKEHIKLLKRIESTVPGIDHKALVSRSEDLIILLRPYLNNNEAVSNCVKFTRSLPKSLKTEFSIESIYYEYALQQFYRTCLDASSLKQCVGHFESILPSLAKVDDEQLVKFVHGTICSFDVVQKLDCAYRRQLLVSLLQWYMNTRTTKLDSNQFSHYLHAKIERLDEVWNDDISEESLSKPKIREYLGCLETFDFEIEESEKINRFSALLKEFTSDCEVSALENQMLIRVLRSLDPLVTTICADSLTEEVVDVENEVSQKSNHASAEEGEPAVNSEDQLLDYLELESKTSSEIVEPKLGNETSFEDFLTILKGKENQIGDDVLRATFQQYEAATSLLEIDLQSEQLQDLTTKVLEALGDSHSDKIFLAWLCLTWEKLNFTEKGESLLKDIGVDSVIQYLNNHHEIQQLVIPVLARSSLYVPLIACMLEHNQISLLQRCVEALRQSGLITEAGTLSIYIKKIPCGLRTFGCTFADLK